MRRTLQAAVLLTVACTVLCEPSTAAINTSTKLVLSATVDQATCGQGSEPVLCGRRADSDDASDAVSQPCRTHGDNNITNAHHWYKLDAERSMLATDLQQNSSSSSLLTPPQDAVVGASTLFPSSGPPQGQLVPEKATNAAESQTVEATLRALRPDLDPSGPLDELEPRYHYGTCTRMQVAPVPSFPDDNSSIQITQQTVPQRLSKPMIRRVKQYAIDHLKASNFNGYGPLAENMTAKESAAVRQTYYELRAVNPSSGFVHPGCVAGPAELALMKERLSDNAALQELALKSLLTGSGVPPKVMRQWNGSELHTWSVPTDTPLNYSGPFPMQEVETRCVR